MEIYPVTLTRNNNETFGLFYDQNNIITALAMGTPSQSSGKIRIGDKIYAINGECVGEGSETNERLAKTAENVIISFKRIGNKNMTDCFRFLYTPFLIIMYSRLIILNEF